MLITGASGAIGSMILQTYITRDWKIITQSLDKVCYASNSHCHANLTTEDGVDTLCSTIKRRLGTIDVCVHCAYSFENPFGMKEWYLFQQLSKIGCKRLILLSTGGSNQVIKGCEAYCAAKRCLETMTPYLSNIIDEVVCIKVDDPVMSRMSQLASEIADHPPPTTHPSSLRFVMMSAIQGKFPSGRIVSSKNYTTHTKHEILCHTHAASLVEVSKEMHSSGDVPEEYEFWDGCENKGYPSRVDKELITGEIANYEKINEDEVLCVGGGITSAVKTVLDCYISDTTNEIITLGHTFPPILYEFQSRGCNVKAIQLELANGRIELPSQLIIEGITPRTRVIYLSNPIYIFGTVIDKQIQDIVDALPAGCVLILDECYMHYVRDCVCTSKNFLKGKNNVIGIRSLSKYFGAAGYRMAYYITNKSIIELLNTKTVWKHMPMMDADDIFYNEEYGERIIKERKKIENELENKGIRYVKGVGTTIVIGYPDGVNTLQDIIEIMKQVKIRVVETDLGVDGWIYTISDDKDVNRRMLNQLLL